MAFNSFAGMAPSVLDFSLTGSLGWAKYNFITPIPELNPEAALFQYLSPSVKAHIVQLYEIASIAVFNKLQRYNFSTIELSK